MYGRIFLIFLFLAVPSAAVFAQEQEPHWDIQKIWRAEVLEIAESGMFTVPGTNVESPVQTLLVELLDGERKGETITFENDFIQLEAGERFYLNYLITNEGDEFYSVREIDRRAAILALLGIFVAVIALFGGVQGLRSLFSLAASLFVIVYVLVPALLAGYSPIPTSIAIAGAVLFCAIFFTHGFNRRSLIAFSGTIIAVALTGLFAHASISWSALSGFASDENIYLNVNTGGQLDLVGLLLAGIIIGALGVLDDIAITQVAVVRELFGSSPNISKREVYRRAMRVGREHVGALVNTLVLAYTGAALPLLLLFSLSESSWWTIVNREIFATEIVRALVGSIGLVLTVPITTLLAVLILEKYRGRAEEAGVPHTHVH